MELEHTDLRNITRESDHCLSTVTIRMGDWWDRGTDTPWLKFGQAQIRKHENSDLTWWQLGAYLKDGATDFEHDSGYAFRMPLVALEYTFTLNHGSRFSAIIHPNMADEFHVPLPGYNPLEHENTQKCDRCTEERAHLIIPQGFYVPPFEPELYKLVAGKPVVIHLGVIYWSEDR
jgi:hypothetical protein